MREGVAYLCVIAHKPVLYCIVFCGVFVPLLVEVCYFFRSLFSSLLFFDTEQSSVTRYNATTTPHSTTPPPNPLPKSHSSGKNKAGRPAAASNAPTEAAARGGRR